MCSLSQLRETACFLNQHGDQKETQPKLPGVDLELALRSDVRKGPSSGTDDVQKRQQDKDRHR
jgi:hypothetical protein